MSDPCTPGTGWFYCRHADDSLAVCRCPCTCLDQAHCPSVARSAGPFAGGTAPLQQIAERDGPHSPAPVGACLPPEVTPPAALHPREERNAK